MNGSFATKTASALKSNFEFKVRFQRKRAAFSAFFGSDAEGFAVARRSA
jgi:hypothetical protein